MTNETELLLQVVATVLSVLGCIWWLDRKITSTRRELQANLAEFDKKLSGEIREVRQASETAHRDILERLTDVRVEQAAHKERLKYIEGRVDLPRSDD